MSASELSVGKSKPAADGAHERLEVAVIGGSQAGLAMGYYLAQQRRRFVIFERGDSVAPAWRERWDSLKLFTPRGYSALPGLPFPVDPDVWQAHSTGYRRPSDVPEGTVLVVGGGNTGFQIAKDLSATHKVLLSVGSKQKPLPQRFAGRDLFWWLTKTGLIHKTVESRLGQRLNDRDTLIGSNPRELRRRYGVKLKPRATDALGRTVRFEDGSELEVDAVIWATGYRPDHSWVDLPILDSNGRLRHHRGVTDVPGLFFLGRTWQWTRGSALIGWVKDDALFLTERLAAWNKAESRTAPERAPEPAPACTRVPCTPRSLPRGRGSVRSAA